MNDPLLRYSRHVSLPQIGAEGQQRLAQSTALIIGLGGLGAPAGRVAEIALCSLPQTRIRVVTTG